MKRKNVHYFNLFLILIVPIFYGCTPKRDSPPLLPIPDLWSETGYAKLKIEGYEDVTINSICLNVNQTFPQFEESISIVDDLIKFILSQIGVMVTNNSSNCDANLSISIYGEVFSADYQDVGECYFGKNVNGELEINVLGYENFKTGLSSIQQNPENILSLDGQTTCPKQPALEMLNYDSHIAVLDGLYQLWGPIVYIKALEFEGVLPSSVTASLMKIERKESLSYLLQGMINKDLQPNTRIGDLLVQLNQYRDISHPGGYFENFSEDFTPAELQDFATLLLYAYRAYEGNNLSGTRVILLDCLNDIVNRSPESIPVPYFMETWRITTAKDEVELMYDLVIKHWMPEKIINQYIPGFIEATTDPNERVRRKAAYILNDITGQDFGEKTSAWQHWYETQENNH